MRPENAFYKDVGRRIRKARETRGLTQLALAGLVSLSRTSITNIEQGRQKLLLDTFVDIAAALRLPISRLLPGGLAARNEYLEHQLKGRSRSEREFVTAVVAAAQKAKK
jgi:transcriptional regulator with XRE-family HTH domain